ncbi:MAG: precorrin-6A reductase [Rhizobiales bacterium]|nr:precorrin-6A reductase [Hyphomicrobiales bacterium]
MRILILGGTKNARILAEAISKHHEITYSIAGKTKSALLPNGCHHISGGFGGANGLADCLRKKNVEICIDATHPFAKNITKNAIIACEKVQIPILQYARKAWQATLNDDWQIFQNTEQLIKTLPKAARILLTIGSQNILPYLPLKQSVIARMIEPPLLQAHKLTDGFEILLARPPFILADEIKLMQQHKISHLICKNSGGETFDNKLLAARKLGIKVFMIDMPDKRHIHRYYKLLDIIQAIDA